MAAAAAEREEGMDAALLERLMIPGTLTIRQAIHRLNETAGRILLVVDPSRRLQGTVTDGDVRRGIIGNVDFEAGVERIMSRRFVSIAAGMPELEARARERMLESGVEQVPVLDQEGRVVDLLGWPRILDAASRLAAAPLLPNRVVIMAGGEGTRLDPFTRILPKPLLPIGDRPVIELIMERFYHQGFHRFSYTLNYKKEYIKAFLRENSYPYEIDWVEEPERLGTAGSIGLLKDRLEETFFVTNCDSLLIDVDFADILDWHRRHGAELTVVGCHNELRIPFGVLEIADGRLARILEKPVRDLIINAGVYVLEPSVLELLPPGRRADMNEVIEQVAQRRRVMVYPISGTWLDIGQWDAYRKAVAHLREGGGDG